MIGRWGFILYTNTMNKVNSIYTTEVLQEDPPQSHLRQSIDSFRRRLDAAIGDTISVRKQVIAKGSSECLEHLQKIRDQANKYRRAQERQEKDFQEKVETHILQDIDKWNDYHSFFRAGFEELQERLQTHQARNRDYLKKISLKKTQLKALLNEDRQSHVRISSLIKLAEGRKSTLTTKESTLLAESLTKHAAFNNADRQEVSLTRRIKTDHSLPVLKPVSRYDRIKTIQSDYQEDQPTRVKSYMEPIGMLRKKEESSLGLLLNLLQWYKQKEENKIGDNWFLKVLFTERHFSKLTRFLQENYTMRKVQRRL